MTVTNRRNFLKGIGVGGVAAVAGVKSAEAETKGRPAPLKIQEELSPIGHIITDLKELNSGIVRMNTHNRKIDLTQNVEGLTLYQYILDLCDRPGSLWQPGQLDITWELPLQAITQGIFETGGGWTFTERGLRHLKSCALASGGDRYMGLYGPRHGNYRPDTKFWAEFDSSGAREFICSGEMNHLVRMPRGDVGSFVIYNDCYPEHPSREHRIDMSPDDIPYRRLLSIHVGHRQVHAGLLGWQRGRADR